ncbi:ATP-binding cassette domain-containing protein, partial [Rhodoplanes roseus]
MPALALCGAEKTFTMHLRGGLRLPVVRGVDFTVEPGECVVLSGPSGAGKSSILKMIWGTYRCDRGAILVRDGDGTTDVATASPREILDLRRRVIASVSQFLRVVPRVPALDVVVEPLGPAASDAGRAAAQDMLRRLALPERLWGLPPATFSGGEQQRINIARGFLPERPILL